MNQTDIATATAHQGLTTRKDAWWVEPALVAIGFTCFIVYATFRAFENNWYEIGTYLSPFYSPKLPVPEFLQQMVPFISPAFLILWIPAGFRATCYYYRKAYYRAYFLDPPACSVGHFGGDKYCGENSFPFILQNLHRYFFYFATIVLAVLWYDVFVAMYNAGHPRLTVLSMVMLANVVFLSGYSFGCHAFRHLVGGRLDCFSCPSAQGQYKLWGSVTKLNEHHMFWAWLSLFSVGFTDFYIRQYAAGAFSDFPLLGPF